MGVNSGTKAKLIAVITPWRGTETLNQPFLNKILIGLETVIKKFIFPFRADFSRNSSLKHVRRRFVPLAQK